jgi:hypothetical protein
MAGSKKKLLEWLADVDEDEDVLKEFRRHGVEAAVTKAIEKGHSLPDDHKRLMVENDPEKITKKLKEESEELQSDAGSVHQFWVLVRI